MDSTNPSVHGREVSDNTRPRLSYLFTFPTLSLPITYLVVVDKDNNHQPPMLFMTYNVNVADLPFHMQQETMESLSQVDIISDSFTVLQRRKEDVKRTHQHGLYAGKKETSVDQTSIVSYNKSWGALPATRI